MIYHIEFTETAKKQLKKLDKFTSSMIIAWLRKNVEGTENPRLHGKALSANRTGQWRYRIGDYRLICEIEDDRLIVLVLTVGHRRDIYEK